MLPSTFLLTGGLVLDEKTNMNMHKNIYTIRFTETFAHTHTVYALRPWLAPDDVNICVRGKHQTNPVGSDVCLKV